MNENLASIPHLEILPVIDLLEHERHDQQRTGPLIKRIMESGLWRNPPIVTPLQDRSQRYMILDGANRVTALRDLDIEHGVFQVVAPGDPGLKLYNWNHVIWNFDAAEILDGLESIKDVSVILGVTDYIGASNDQSLAKFETSRGDQYTFCSPVTDLVTRTSQLNAIVDIYKSKGSLDRTSEWSPVRLKTVYENLCGLMIFPKLEVKQVLFLAGRGCLLPTGITRFSVSPRALHINFPLEVMSAQISIEEKRNYLREFLNKRITQKGVRYYAEATYLFDE